MDLLDECQGSTFSERRPGFSALASPVAHAGYVKRECCAPLLLRRWGGIAHDVAFAAEDLDEARHEEVCCRQDVDVGEGAERVVADDEEFVRVC